MRFFLLFAVLLLAGCASTDSNSAAQPRYGSDVQVAVYDSTLRPPTDKLIIIREPSDRKYHIIATLTIDGKAENEGELINALAWKARQIGADSILVLTTLHPHRTHWIFRADAIVMDSDK